MTLYDEGQVVAFQSDVRKAYEDAHEPYNIVDDSHVVWTARMQYDAFTLGYAEARKKHLDGLRKQLGSATQPAPAPSGGVFPFSVVGSLRVAGNRFVDDRGGWPWRMITAFDACRLFVNKDWGTLDPYAAYSRDVGANGWRVFLNWAVTGFDFRAVLNQRQMLNDFAIYTRDQGLAVEWTTLCDCQRFMPPIESDTQHAIVDIVADVAAQHSHIFQEIANEPWNNGVDPMAFNTSRPGLLIARGAGFEGAVYVPSLGYTTVHMRRTPEWYRYCGKDAGIDARNITKDAVVVDEPNKISITGYTPADWERAAYNAAMFTAGMTVHGNSDTLQRCHVPTGDEDTLVRLSFAAMRRVPVDAPTWAYARYGPAAPNVPMPVERDQDGDDVIRLYAKVGENDAVALSLHHSAEDGWTPRGANGWSVVSQRGPFVVCKR